MAQYCPLVDESVAACIFNGPKTHYCRSRNCNLQYFPVSILTNECCLALVLGHLSVLTQTLFKLYFNTMARSLSTQTSLSITQAPIDQSECNQVCFNISLIINWKEQRSICLVYIIRITVQISRLIQGTFFKFSISSIRGHTEQLLKSCSIKIININKENHTTSCVRVFAWNSQSTVAVPTCSSFFGHQGCVGQLFLQLQLRRASEKFVHLFNELLLQLPQCPSR